MKGLTVHKWTSRWFMCTAFVNPSLKWWMDEMEKVKSLCFAFTWGRSWQHCDWCNLKRKMQRVTIHLAQTKRRQTTIHPHSLCLGLPVFGLSLGGNCSTCREARHTQHSNKPAILPLQYSVFFLLEFLCFTFTKCYTHSYTHTFKPLFDNNYYYSKKKKKKVRENWSN